VSVCPALSHACNLLIFNIFLAYICPSKFLKILENEKDFYKILAKAGKRENKLPAKLK
jgi:hypothetical protein